MNRAAGARPAPDKLLVDIAEYVAAGAEAGALAFETARLCLLDALGCALLALNFPDCARLLGPIVPGATLPDGARVPGTPFALDPVQAAFNLGSMIRWLDFNDTWLAAEWGHPSDNFGAILAVADYLDRRELRAVTMREVLSAAIKAYEIQGVLALENAFNRVGLDHVILVKAASCAVVTRLLGGDTDTIAAALSQAFVDGHPLRTYRHAPNTGSRKSWAAGDAASRAVWLALIACRGEMGYPGALSAPRWGFYDALFGGKPFRVSRPFGSYVVENVLFKIAYPAEFHAQTAVECALRLHPLVKDRIARVERVAITTHESALRIIDKTGPLHNPADRDHCLQYMVAVPLLFGRLAAEDYGDEIASDPRIDALRAKMVVAEDRQYSADYLDPAKRSIANALQVFFDDGTCTERVAVEYPLGHRRRRAEGLPLLMEKFARNLASRFDAARCALIQDACADRGRLERMRVRDFVELFVAAN